MERLREKHQFSLDDRQVAALAFCALLLIGAVFAVGVTLGKHLASAAAPPGPADLAQLDARAITAARAAPKPASVSAASVTLRPSQSADAPQGPVPPKVAGEAPRSVSAAAGPAPLVVPAPPRAVQIASLAPVAPLSPPPRDLGPYTVQIGAARDRADAQRLEAKARSAGLKPYVVEADLGRAGLWYRVRVGSFADKETANLFRKDVERELRSSAVVMATH